MPAGLELSPGLHECRVCRKYFQSALELCEHSRHKLHAAFACDQLDCKAEFISDLSLNSHKSFPHEPGHREVKWTPENACIQCDESSPNKTQLEYHGRRQNHSPFSCSCGTKFTRHSLLKRHIYRFDNDGRKFTCPFKKCPRFKKGFNRNDHLIQHLEGKHSLNPAQLAERYPTFDQGEIYSYMACPIEGCEFYRGEDLFHLQREVQRQQTPFRTLGMYRKHMKDIHEETPFSCTVPGCNRIGRKGYLLKKDFMKHLADSHPEAPPYVAGVEEYTCRRRCGKKFQKFEEHQDHEADGWCMQGWYR
ncbi:hypothetical protein F4775DRAFT_343817 [Biscogniauxia sp. FL1348]|nr:hypothetical protein F4775DRAFT_343817 [Biscogniauxia sp. FL1348]